MSIWHFDAKLSLVTAYPGRAAQQVLLCFAILGSCLLAACGDLSTLSTSRTATSLGNRTPSCAVGSRDASYLYVADNNNGLIDIFATNSLDKGPIDKISDGISYPEGIYVDPAQTLFVANGDESGHDTVTAYAKGAHTPMLTYKGFGFAVDVVEGSDGVVYIADADDKRVVEYAPGSTRRLRVLRLKGYPSSLTLDSDNNLYVAYLEPHGYASQVKKYAAGATEGRDILPANVVSFIGSIFIDKRGQLLVVNDGHGGVDVFQNENTPPAQVIHTNQTYPNSLAFDARENKLYVSSFYFSDLRRSTSSGPQGANTVVELPYPKLNRVKSLAEPTWGPTGLAIFPGACFGPPF